MEMTSKQLCANRVNLHAQTSVLISSSSCGSYERIRYTALSVVSVDGPRVVGDFSQTRFGQCEVCVTMAEAKDKVVFVTKEDESDAGERYASDDSEGES